jgi:putative membrane protein
VAKANEFHAVPKESHAREFLASERTFLAWIRTSIAVLSFGFAIIKVGDWQGSGAQNAGFSSSHIADIVGTLMVVFSGVMSALGAIHYRRTNKQILEGKVQASNWLVLSISAGVVLLAIAVIIYLVFRGEY